MPFPVDLKGESTPVDNCLLNGKLIYVALGGLQVLFWDSELDDDNGIIGVPFLLGTALLFFPFL